MALGKWPRSKTAMFAQRAAAAAPALFRFRPRSVPRPEHTKLWLCECGGPIGSTDGMPACAKHNEPASVHEMTPKAWSEIASWLDAQQVGAPQFVDHSDGRAILRRL